LPASLSGGAGLAQYLSEAGSAIGGHDEAGERGFKITLAVLASA
jgi:hypothetical protein